MRILKLIWKNTLRHKLRSMLTILGIAIAVMAFGLLRTVVTAWYSGVESSAVNRIITRHAVSFIFPLPFSYRDQIQRIPGVSSVTFANWFQGVYIDRKQFFARLAVDADTYFENYPEFTLVPEQLATFKRERNSCVIGEKIAQTYKLKIGDVMPVEGDIYPGTYEFVVRGIYKPRDKRTDATQMLFHWQYLDEQLKQTAPVRAGQVGWYVITINDPGKAAVISQFVDALFANSRAETKTETEAAFQQSFVSMSGAIITAMNFISFVIIGIILLVLGNTMVMTARERIREYAVFKTLGFTKGHLVGLIAGESLFISMWGGALGLLLTFPITKGFEDSLPSGWFPTFNVEPSTLILSVSSAFLVGLLASVFPIWRATSMKIVDGLRQLG
jgi:putative ABC transport system permease protein